MDHYLTDLNGLGDKAIGERRYEKMASHRTANQMRWTSRSVMGKLVFLFFYYQYSWDNKPLLSYKASGRRKEENHQEMSSVNIDKIKRVQTFKIPE